MAGIIPGPLIAGPEPIGRRYGLLSAAAGPIDLPPHGEGGGVRYVPVSCGAAHSWPIDCVDGLPGADDKQGDPDTPMFESDPFTVYASLVCGPVGYTTAEFRRDVERRLLNGEQGAAEYALWTGNSDVGGASLGIANLTDSAIDITVSDPADIAAVVSALEEWAYLTEGYGSVAYIHAPVSVAAWAASLYLVVKDGNLLKTPYGSIWVFGGGYPGTGIGGDEPPAGGANIIITGQTTVWRSPQPTTFSEPQATLDRSTNQDFLLSEREYAIGFDCMAGRALFNPLGGS